MGWRKKKEVGGRRRGRSMMMGLRPFSSSSAFSALCFNSGASALFSRRYDRVPRWSRSKKRKERWGTRARKRALSLAREKFSSCLIEERESGGCRFFSLAPSLLSSLLSPRNVDLFRFSSPLTPPPPPPSPPPQDGLCAIHARFGAGPSDRLAPCRRPRRRPGERGERARERGRRIAAKEEIFFPFDVRRWPPENFGDALDRSTARSTPFFHFFLSSTALWLQVLFVRAHRYQNQTHSLTIHPRFPSSKKPIQKSYLSPSFLGALERCCCIVAGSSPRRRAVLPLGRRRRGPGHHQRAPQGLGQ